MSSGGPIDDYDTFLLNDLKEIINTLDMVEECVTNAACKNPVVAGTLILSTVGMLCGYNFLMLDNKKAPDAPNPSGKTSSNNSKNERISRCTIF